MLYNSTSLHLQVQVLHRDSRLCCAELVVTRACGPLSKLQRVHELHCGRQSLLRAAAAHPAAMSGFLASALGQWGVNRQVRYSWSSTLTVSALPGCWRHTPGSCASNPVVRCKIRRSGHCTPASYRSTASRRR